MVTGVERGEGSDLGDEAAYALLLCLRYVDIGHRPAVEADQVVMMTGQPLGELEPGQSLGAEMVGDDTSFLEDRECPIDRREWDLGAQLPTELGCRHRPRCPSQGIDHGATTLGVSHVVLVEPHLDLAIELGFGHDHILMIMILNSMITILISRYGLRKGLESSRGRLIASLTALALVASACGGSAAGEDDRPLVVATTSIWGDVVGQVVGDQARVEVLIPVGADAHDYEPTQQQVAKLLEADLVVANGLGLEEGLHDILESAAADGANIFEVAPEVDPLPFADHEHEDENADDESHDHGDLDPHVWFDLTRVDTAAGLIAEQLAGIDDSVDWVARASDYSATLLQTDAELMQALDSVAEDDRKLVTNHEALGYFAARYGFEVVAVVIPGGSTLGDPSSAELAELVEEMTHERVTTIFAETSQPTRLAEAVAAEVGDDVQVVELHTESLGDPGSEAGTLTGMLLANARAIAEALSG